MKYFIAIALFFFVIFIGSASYSVYATEPKPFGINVLDYGIFDANVDDDDVITHELVVGQEYKIKTKFESELDIPVTFSYNIQVIDKNKHWTETVDEFRAESFLQPNDIHHTSFGFVPQYAGSFRTFAVFTNVIDGTTIGGIPQYDFEVISDTAIDEKKGTKVISTKTSDMHKTNEGNISDDDDDIVYHGTWEDIPPLKQFKDGVPFQEIQCKSYLQKMIKHDGTPACIKSETIPKLVDRGWAKELKTKSNYMSQGSDMQDSQKLIRLLEAGKVSEFNLVKKTMDLSRTQIHLEGVNLQGIDLRDMDLYKVRLYGANMQDADLRGMNLEDKALHNVNLQGADLRNANLGRSYLYDANLKNANLEGAILKGAHLGNADLTGANFVSSNVSGVVFTGATVRNGNFQNANLQGSDFSKMGLTSANFEGADMQYSKLKYSDLQNANLKDVNLFSTDLENANLRYADLSGANLHGANLNYANLMSTNLMDAKNLPISNEQAREKGAIIFVGE